MPFLTRLWFSYVCFFAVLFDGVFAARVKALRDGDPELLRGGPESERGESDGEDGESEDHEDELAAHDVETTPAIQLLALLQREGRLIDFLEQDVGGFSDADVAAAARVVHAGCRKTLRDHATISPVLPDDEGRQVTLAAGFDPSTVKLTGNVTGSAPYRGTLRHRGWRVTALELPHPVGDHDQTVIAPAEVEL